MAELKLPAVKGKSNHWPKKPLCPICGKSKVFEPHSMAILAAGAVLMDRTKDCGGPSNDLDGFLALHWHGAHNDGGQGENSDVFCGVDIVRDASRCWNFAQSESVVNQFDHLKAWCKRRAKGP